MDSNSTTAKYISTRQTQLTGQQNGQTAYSSTRPYRYNQQLSRREQLEKVLVPTYRMKPCGNVNSADPWFCSVSGSNLAFSRNQVTPEQESHSRESHSYDSKESHQQMLVFRDEEDLSVMSGWSETNLISSAKKSRRRNLGKKKKGYRTKKWNPANAISKFTHYNNENVQSNQKSNNDSSISILPNFIKHSRKLRSRQQQSNSKQRSAKDSLNKYSSKGTSKKSSETNSHALVLHNVNDIPFYGSSKERTTDRTKIQSDLHRRHQLQQEQVKSQNENRNHLRQHEIQHCTQNLSKIQSNNHQITQLIPKQPIISKNSDKTKGPNNQLDFFIDTEFEMSRSSSSHHSIPSNSSKGISNIGSSKMAFEDFRQYEDPNLDVHFDDDNQSISNEGCTLFSQYNDPPLWCGNSDIEGNARETSRTRIDALEKYEAPNSSSDKKIQGHKLLDSRLHINNIENYDVVDEYDDDYVSLNPARVFDENQRETNLRKQADKVLDQEIKYPINRQDFIGTVAAIVIQTEVRRFLALNRSYDRRWAVDVIQSNCRSYIKKQNHVAHLEQSATKIQACYRSWLVRDILLIDNYCAIQIQTCVRRFLAKRKLVLILNGLHNDMRNKLATTIQARYRGYSLRKRIIEHSCAMYIQTSWRCFSAQFRFQLHRIGAIIIQAYTRRFLIQRQLDFIHSAATKIQSSWRSYDSVMNYMHTLADILIIQSVARRWLVQKKALLKLRKRVYRKNKETSKKLIQQRKNSRAEPVSQALKTTANHSCVKLKKQPPLVPNLKNHPRRVRLLQAERVDYLKGVSQEPYFVPD